MNTQANTSQPDTENKPKLTILTTPKYGKGGYGIRIKELAKKMLGRKRGPDQVVNSLMRGLKEIKVAYNINPSIESLAPIVHVPMGAEILLQAIDLKRRGLIKTLIAGPSIVVTPLDGNRILFAPEIDIIVLPAQWVKDLYTSLAPELAGKIEVWPSGVAMAHAIKETSGEESDQKIATSSMSGKSIDQAAQPRCIVYSKNAPQDLQEKVLQTLIAKHISHRIFTYGTFKQPAYFDAMQQADFIIFLSPSESQGLALQEAWMRNIPTLVWNRKEWHYAGKTWHDEKISAPYLTDDSGMFFSGPSDFETKLASFIQKLDGKNNSPKFAPRKYVLENLTDKKSAERLMEISSITDHGKKIPTHLNPHYHPIPLATSATAQAPDSQSAIQASHKKYFDYLDALRCLAFLLVFYAHTGTIFLGANVSQAFPLNFWNRFTVYGSYGVNFFFVLSGFLITYLLLKEKLASSPDKNNADKGTVSIRDFYRKRVLRIWPVYFVTLFFGAFILPLLISSATYEIFTMTNPLMSARTFFYNLFFSGNFYQGMGIAMAPLSIGILWSVCIEEQFYLVWPWIVKWCSVRRLAFITSLLITLSLLYKFIWADDRMANYYLPWSLAMDLGFGALLGISYFSKRIKNIITSSAFIIGASIALTLAIAIINRSQLVEILRLTKTPIIDGVFVLVILFFINRTKALADAAKYGSTKHPVFMLKKLRDRIYASLTHLGKISYGLYAYHTSCMMLTVAFLHMTGLLGRNVDVTDFFITIILAFILTIMVAELSYNCLEKRILARKTKVSK